MRKHGRSRDTGPLKTVEPLEKVVRVPSRLQGKDQQGDDEHQADEGGEQRRQGDAFSPGPRSHCPAVSRP